MDTHLKQMQILIDAGEPFVYAILVDSKGSTPRAQGGKILVTTSGLYSGTVGGGLIEAKSVKFAQDLLRETKPTEKTKFVEWNLNKDVGMSCGGSVKIFFELYNLNTWEIIIFGAENRFHYDDKINKLEHRKLDLMVYRCTEKTRLEGDPPCETDHKKIDEYIQTLNI